MQRSPKKPAQLLAKLRRAPAARLGELELIARRALVMSLVATLKTIKTINEQIKQLERQIPTALREHPDGAIFLSLFKKPSSVICAADLLAEIGDCRARYPTRDTLAADAGQAAVAIESGKRKAACFRWACNKRLRGAVCTLPDTTRHHNPWAQDLYATAKARGHDHPHAIRTFGRAWWRIVWRCWEDRTPYDHARHRACNNTSPSPSPHRQSRHRPSRHPAHADAHHDQPRRFPAQPIPTVRWPPVFRRPGGKPHSLPQPNLSGASRRTANPVTERSKGKVKRSNLDSHAASATMIEVQVRGHPTPRRLPGSR